MRHQLTTWYFDNKSNTRATPGQFRWYKSPGPGLKIGAKPQGLPGGGCSRLELIDALLFYGHSDLSVIVNHGIIEETIKFIRSTWRFEKH